MCIRDRNNILTISPILLLDRVNSGQSASIKSLARRRGYYGNNSGSGPTYTSTLKTYEYLLENMVLTEKQRQHLPLFFDMKLSDLILDNFTQDGDGNITNQQSNVPINHHKPLANNINIMEGHPPYRGTPYGAVYYRTTNWPIYATGNWSLKTANNKITGLETHDD